MRRLISWALAAILALGLALTAALAAAPALATTAANTSTPANTARTSTPANTATPATRATPATATTPATPPTATTTTSPSSTSTSATCSTGGLTAIRPAYAREGHGVPVTLNAQDPSQLSNVTITFLQGTTTLSTTAVTLTGSTTEVSIPAPGSGTTLSIEVAWSQAEADGASCAATSTAAIPLIPATAKAGDPTRPRLTGAFTIDEKPYNYRGADSRPKWTFTPSCGYFACAATLASSQGLELKLALAKSGIYHGFVTADAQETAQSCQVAHTHLYTIKNAYSLREDVYVRIRQSEAGNATKVSGSLIAVYTPTKAARRQGCDYVERAVEQYTGRLAARQPSAPSRGAARTEQRG